MKKEEAEKKLKEYQVEERSDTNYCPLIKEQCRHDCVCFEKANIRETSKYGDDCYYPYKHSCNNAMFFETEININ